MTGFSIGEAAKSGLRIIRDHPGAVLMWSLAYFVIALLPQVGMLAIIWPDLMRATEEAARTAGPDGPKQADIEAALGMQAQMMLMQAVQMLTTVLWMVLFYGAVYRVVLEPQNKGWWYMRLGEQEFWLGVVSVVGFVIVLMVVLAVMLPVGIFAAAFAAMGGQMTASGWMIAALLAAAVFGVLWWIGIRLSLAYPMSFAERKFRLFESWTLTKGHAWRIFLTMLAVLGVVLLASVAMLAVGLLVIVILGVSAGASEVLDPGGMDAFFENPPAYWPALAVGAVLIWCALASISTAVLYTIALAPFATIYRRLSATPTPAT